MTYYTPLFLVSFKTNDVLTNMNIILLFQFLGDWYMLKRKPTGAKKISVDKYAWHVTKGTGNTLNIRQTGR